MNKKHNIKFVYLRSFALEMRYTARARVGGTEPFQCARKPGKWSRAHIKTYNLLQNNENFNAVTLTGGSVSAIEGE